MSLTPPLRNPRDDRPITPRPWGPETGVYIARVYHGSETSVEAFVVSLNLKRRHLSEEQRAMVAGRLANLEEGRPEKTAQICAVSQSDAAELLNVSRRSVQHAVAVQRDGAPELIAAVRDDYAAGMWAYALTGRQKVPVYKNGLYYTASKRYFRAPKTPRWGNVVLRHVSLGKFCRLRCQNGKREAKINDFSGFYELCMGLTHIEELRQ